MEALTPRRRGRPFNTGNPGRRPGSKNRTTVVSEALLRGEATELVRKAIELAKGGNVPMLKVLVERILPKERSIEIDLPTINSSAEAAGALGSIIDAVATGRITPSEPAAVASFVTSYAQTLNAVEFGARVAELEKTQKEIQHSLENLPKRI
jgi:hypothetical protein